MSAEAVRTAARAMVAHVSWPAVPFHETVSDEPDPATIDSLPLWSTLEFDAYDTESLGVGPLPKAFRESGRVTVWVLGLSGRGDSAVITAIGSVRDAVNAWASWPSGFQKTVQGPVEYGLSEDGQWLRMGVEIEYTYEYVQT